MTPVVSTNPAAAQGGLGDFLAKIGAGAYEWVVGPIYRRNGDALFPLALALAVAVLVVMIWRSWTKAGQRLVLKRPGLYHKLHAAWWAPTLVLLGAFGVMGFAPLLHPSLKNPQKGWEPRPWTPPLNEGIQTIEETMGVMGLLLVGGTIFAGRRFFREKVWMGQHGSAFWARRSEVRIAPQKLKNRKSWRWVLPMAISWRGTAKNWKKSGAGKTAMAIENEEGNRHWLLIGSSGSGKGYTVFSPIIASSRQPFILQDVKSECQGLDTLRQLTGHEPIRFGCAARGGWPSMRWNPLHEARHADNPEDECASLAAKLCPEQGNQNDFIQKLAADTLSFIFLYGSEQTLSEISAAIEFEGLIAYMARIGVTPGLLGRLEGKNMENWVSDAIKGALSSFSSGWGKEVTSSHDFYLDEMFEKGGFVLSAEPIPSRALPIRVFWGMLLQRMLTSNKARNLTLLYDEGLAAGKIPNFEPSLATLRSKGISIIFGVQHTAGVLALYGANEGKGILDSFVNSIWLLNGLNPDDQKKLSLELGKQTVIEKDMAGEGKNHRRHAQVSADLLEIADLERRSRIGDFWAVIRAQKLTSSGSPIIAKLTGSAGAGLVRHPKPEEIEAAKAAIAEIQQPSPYVPKPVPERTKFDEVPKSDTKVDTTSERDETGDGPDFPDEPIDEVGGDYPPPPPPEFEMC